MKINFRTMLFLAGVFWVVSGTNALAHTDVTAEQARELIDSTDDLTVIDVREPYEYNSAGGHIPGALNYPWNSGVLQARYEELPMDGPVLVVCGSGSRSNRAANFLDSKDFSIVYDMLGGMRGWIWETETGVDSDIKYGGGTGEPNDPYQIATAEDLMLLGDSPEDYDKHFILTADIDLDPNLPGRKIFDRAVIAPDMNDTEDGFQGTPFTGAFDGNSHVISNLHIQGGDYMGYLGLFGQLGSRAMVTNLGMEAVDINSTGNYIGGLVGQNDGSIATSYCTGTVSGNMYFGDYVGGLVGQNHGNITTSYSTVTVTGRENVGGLAGSNGSEIAMSYNTSTVNGRWKIGGLVGMNYGSNTTCHSTGTVTGEWDVGGLVGSNSDRIAMSYSTSTVSGDGGVGGLVGLNWGEITMSYSTGTVTGDTAVGGFVGLNVGIITTSFSTSIVTGNVETGGLVGQNGVNIPTRERNGSVINCYSTSAVTGDWAVGGLVGANRLGNIDMSYSTGVVTDTDPNSLSPPIPPDDPFDPIYKGAGGLVGGNISNITSCFWDMETSSQTTSDGGTGKTTAEMQTAGTFLEAGWDFVGETENGTEDIWSICEGTNYPRFLWQIAACDFVCPDGITIDDFLFFMEHWLDDNCDLSNDYCDGTDLDQSGTVDENDLVIFLENWLAEK